MWAWFKSKIFISKSLKALEKSAAEKIGSEKFFYLFIMYSRKVQKKYNAELKLQERSQEKHMVVWL